VKYLKIILFFLLFTSNANASGVGKGPLTLSPGTVDYFYDYVKGGYGKSPGSFLVTLDGEGGAGWTCPEGSCQPTNVKDAIIQCEQFYQKECKLFASRRTIKWKNDINPGKGKVSRMNSRWSRSEFENKLRDLGFID
jgi:hypothetical protein